MRYRTLGATGIQVTPYCLGAMMFGSIGNPDHDDSIRIIHRALDAGINFIDTADMHSRGESELIVGNALKGLRDNVVVATKVNGPMGEDPNMRGTSRRWIMTAVEGSLRRLQTDYIDLYQTHRLDPTVDKEETLSALTDLVRAARSAPSGPPPSPPPTSSWALAFAITHPLTPSEPQHYADARQMPATRHNRQPASLAAPSRRASALAVLPVSAVLHPGQAPSGRAGLCPLRRLLGHAAERIGIAQVIVPWPPPERRAGPSALRLSAANDLSPCWRGGIGGDFCCLVQAARS